MSPRPLSSVLADFIYLLTDSLNDFWPCINTSFLFQQKRLNVPVDISLKGDFGKDQSFIEYVSVRVWISSATLKHLEIFL